MARAATLAAMTLRAQQLSDQDIPASTTTFVTALEWTDNINQAMTEVYDALVNAGPADYYAGTQAYTTTAGTSTYALPTDFRALVNLFQVDNTSGRKVPLSQLENSNMGLVIAPRTGVTMSMEYIPAPPTLSAPSDTFDGVSGWEELISVIAARKAVAKEDGDIGPLNLMASELRARMGAKAQRVRAPRFATDIRATVDRGPWASNFYGATPFPLVGYRLRAGNIEVYEPLYGLVA